MSVLLHNRRADTRPQKYLIAGSYYWWRSKSVLVFAATTRGAMLGEQAIYLDDLKASEPNAVLVIAATDSPHATGHNRGTMLRGLLPENLDDFEEVNVEIVVTKKK